MFRSTGVGLIEMPVILPAIKLLTCTMISAPIKCSRTESPSRMDSRCASSSAAAPILPMFAAAAMDCGTTAGVKGRPTRGGRGGGGTFFLAIGRGDDGVVIRDCVICIDGDGFGAVVTTGSDFFCIAARSASVNSKLPT